MKTIYPATLLCDFYKVSHMAQYPEGTEVIYSTWTPRTSRIPEVTEVVAFGFQGFIKEYLIDYFNVHFFQRPLEDVVEEYKRILKCTLGTPDPDASHIVALHKLGYLPLLIHAVPEGTKVPIRCAMLTVENTVPEFFWLTNYIETLMSSELWHPTTSATLAYEYRKLFDHYAELTSDAVGATQFQGHDFSMRGMSGLRSSALSGAGHLLSFVGTDTIPAIAYHEHYYNANIENELVGTSIPATEHSVMCAYGKESEFDTYKRLITEIYPTGFVSIVSDTWDFWKVLTEVIAPLKQTIIERDGKVVIRPDSGDPVKIVCGDPYAENENARKGMIQILWEIFGGTVNSKGFKELDPHIGGIYGDAITLTRAKEISEELMKNGFASTNMVYGIGSYTYQCQTRDTFGFALKSTYAVVNGQERFIFKDPVTDNGIKKSQTGMVNVVQHLDGTIHMHDGLTSKQRENLHSTILDPIFSNGELLKETSLKEIRERLLK